MYRVISWAVSFILLVVSLSVLSLIPLDIIGKNIVLSAKKNNIIFHNTNPWHFKIFTLQGSSTDFNISTPLKSFNLVLKGEQIDVSLKNKNIALSSTVIEVSSNKEYTIKDFIQEIIEISQNEDYAIQFNNLIIQFLDSKNDKKNIIQELFIRKLNISNIKNKLLIDIKLDSIFTKNSDTKHSSIDLYFSQENGNIIAKIKSDNINCRTYIEKDKGQFICNIHSLKSLLNEIGYNQDILDQSITLDSNISIMKNKTISSGVVKVGSNEGYFSSTINHDKNPNISILLKMNNIDFDSISENVNVQDANLKVSFIESNPWIENLLNDNYSLYSSGNDLFKIIRELIGDMKISFKAQVENIKLRNNNIAQLLFDIEKNNGIFIINKLSANFGKEESKNTITINSLPITRDEKRSSKINIAGNKLSSILEIFNIKYSNPALNNQNYEITGIANSSINELDVDLFVGIEDKEPIEIIYKKQYNNKIIKKENNITKYVINLKNAKMSELFDSEAFYKNIYNKFEELNNDKHQKSLLKIILDHLTQFEDRDIIININNSTYNSLPIESLTAQLISSNGIVNANFQSNCQYLKGLGKVLLELKQNAKPELNIKVNLDKLDLDIFNELINDFFAKIQITPKQLLFSNKNYNIISLLGINGRGVISANNILLNNSHNELNGSFEIIDGIIRSEDLSFKGEHGTIALNSQIFLQSYPKFDIAFATSGLEVSHGNISTLLNMKGTLYSDGFNPVSALKKLKGQISFTANNFAVKNFGLLELSKGLITKNLNKNYQDIIENNNLVFPVAEGNVIIKDSNIKGIIKATRELVSFEFGYEFDIFDKILNKLEGSFVIIAGKNQKQDPIPIYIPVACNGIFPDFNCIKSLSNIDDFINKSS